MEDVLELKESDQLWMALDRDGYDSIRDIALLIDNDINELSFEEKVSGKDGADKHVLSRL